MTAVVSFDRTELEPVDPQGFEPTEEPQPPRRPRRIPRDPGAGSLHWAWCPAFLSVSVNAIFLVSWWAPEFAQFAGRSALLEQLWPLAAKDLTSSGQAAVPAQAAHSGLLAALTLIASVLLAFLARSRRRPVRVIVPVAAVYVGALTWIVTAVQLFGGQSRAWWGLVLLSAWVLTAALTVWRSRLVSAADLPPERLRIGWLVAVFALLYPIPLALGRAVFASDAGNAARQLLAADPTQQFQTLSASSSLLAYLAGVLMAMVIWAVYMLVPPYAKIRVPWVRRRPVTVDPLVARLVVAVICVAALVLIAFPTAEASRAQARQWLSGNPSGDELSCASWVQDRPGRPTATLLARGGQCRALVAYAGYTEVGRSELGPAVQAVKATMPNKQKITSRVVAARYGAVVVLAGTGAVDFAPDELFGVSVDDAQTVWSFRCDDDQPMRLRFAGADSTPGASKATEAAAGQITNPGERAAVVVACTNQAVRLDPSTGRPAG